MSKKHYDEIDIAKGIGIFLVVFGHTITQYASTPPPNFYHSLYNFIYLFHMPLMFFLSGLLCARSISAGNFKMKLHNCAVKAKRLMIPYFFVGIMFIPINILMSGYKRNTFTLGSTATIFLGNNPEGELWFLYVLFVFSVFAIFVVNKKTVKYVAAAALIISCASPYMTPALTSISLSFSLYQLFPFILGVWVGSEYEKVRDRLNTKTITIITLVIAIPFCIFDINKGLLPLKVLAALFMVWVVCLISLLISTKCSKRVVVPLKTIGSYSMDIYIMHHALLVILRIIFGESGKFPLPITVFVICGTTLSMLLAVLISKYIIRKIPVVRTLILGM